jgi:undecaprenyl-diphosphatase
MHIVQALILGVVQGLTEFIPVSSSGHLILVGHLIGFEDSSLGFDTALDIGTLLALLIFFWRDFVGLSKGLVTKTDQSKLAWLLVLATIPAVVAGVLLQSLAETTFRSSQLVAINLIAVAFIMLAADKLAKRNLGIKDIGVGRALSIGLAQALALVPGVSRSGITISAGMLTGLDGVSATRFSFLLSAPVIAGATLKVMIKPENLHQLTAEPLMYLVAILAAFASGYWAIRFMLKYLSRHGLAIFAYYRIVVGVIILAIGLK